MNKLEIRTAVSLASVYVLRMLGLFMVMPVLAILAQDYDGYSTLMVGLAIGGYGLTQALLQIPMGILSDRIGRKPVILAGLLIFAAGSLVAGMADSMWQLVLGRVMQGAGAIAGAIMALAGDVSRENQRTKMMAIIGVSIGFSFYLAVILGPVLSAQYGLNGLFMITAVCALAAMPLIYFAIPTTVNVAPQGDTLPLTTDIKRLVGERSLMRLNLSVLVLHMLITLIFTQIPSLIVAAGMPLAEHWEIYLPVLILSVAGLALIMRLSKGWVLRYPLMLNVALLMLAFGGFRCLPETLPWVMVSLLVFFVGFNYIEANLPALVSTIAPAGKKGSAMGLFASFQFFGAFLGGVLSGWFGEQFGAESVYLLAMLMCLAWLWLLSGLNGSKRLKRYTLSLNQQHQDVQELAQQLAALPGVADVTVIIEEDAVYLKVEDDQFNLQKARQIAGLQQ